MKRNEDNRKSFRIMETALIRYQVLDAGDFDAGIARWRLRSGDSSQIRSKLIDLDSRLDDLMFRAVSESPTTSHVLRLLNDKINIVAQGLPDFEEARQALTAQTPMQIELSSEGARFDANENLPPETGIVLQFMVLPVNRYFESFARVVRTTMRDSTEPGSNKYQIAVQFHGMSPAELENLIHYLFTRQSETLRLRRKEQDDND